ncbi:ABC transporter permease subunit [Nocardioides sp. MAH-18]|uniref:ABC transporter permease subunit n=1 Tax=Nocardioides agri TaxID=2682843 RepID=A0A6L6XQ97_9ACTN|nr:MULTISPECIES: sugar ABC transporter permease [unclassified Nocardioides]MBA2954617.1 sugar ABC transporter permease [Nocardioides sp. CGMCC 1.13656]MVQ49474.1 ABC transporter permease subunit [Nocardioides sp. MAH-18]
MERVLGDKKTILVLLGPALIVYTVVMLAPVVISMGYAFFDGNAITGFTWTGTDNFQRLFDDPDVRSSLWFTLKYGLILTVLQVGLGYGLALLYVFVLQRGSALVRTLIFFPVVLPTVAVALLFQKLFEIAPQEGPVNAFLGVLGGSPIDFFGDGGHAFWVVILMDLWRSAGFYGVLLYAGLVDVPEEMLESARLEGASTYRLVRHMIIPLSMPVLLSALIFSINGTLKVFDSIVALTNGGPGNETTPLTLYMFQTSFSYGDYGYGASIALMLTVLCLLFTVFIFRSARRDVTEA